jgi:hypothetical protein
VANDQAERSQVQQWSWWVDEGVPPTDLTKRGADDRVLGVYFVFGEVADPQKGPLSLLGSSSITALVYVLGGDKPRGTAQPAHGLAREVHGAPTRKRAQGHLVR